MGEILDLLNMGRTRSTINPEVRTIYMYMGLAMYVAIGTACCNVYM